ncbi:olfactory receptor 52K1-like [Discoglossus pictus]
MANQSEVFYLQLIGFPGLPQKFYVLVSMVMFLVYISSLSINGTVIGLIIFKECLHQPIHLITANLALSDLLFDSITLPKIIAMYWFGSGSISFFECLFQVFFVHYFGSLNSFVIMFMVVDRYVVICKPLRYSNMVTNKLVSIISCFIWTITTFIPLTIVILDAQIPLCGHNIINGCFCTNAVVTGLSCTNITFIKQLAFDLAMFVIFLPLCFIMILYIFMLKTFISSAHSKKQQKAFSPCITHLYIITLYYAPQLVTNLTNKIHLFPNADFNVVLLCVITFMPHLANPIIYCSQTKEIRQIFGNVLKRKLIKRAEDNSSSNTITE